MYVVARLAADEAKVRSPTTKKRFLLRVKHICIAAYFYQEIGYLVNRIWHATRELLPTAASENPSGRNIRIIIDSPFNHRCASVFFSCTYE